MNEISQKPYVILSCDPSNDSANRTVAMRVKNVLQAYGINTLDVDQRGDSVYELAFLLDTRPNVVTDASAVILVISSDSSLSTPHIFQEAIKNLILVDVHTKYEEILASLILNLEAQGIATAIHIRINENPLTAYNLATNISALTELSTKYWLIAKERFADLIEYTQTHNGWFAEEANIVVTKITHNSPMNIDWKVDLSAPSVAEALVATIDGIAQRRERLEKAKLETQAKALEIKEAERKVEQENQMALLEQTKQHLELEQRRLEILEKQLEVQKKGIEYALETAGKVVDALRPSADPATRAMVIQALLPDLVQLQNGRGLDLALKGLDLALPARLEDR